MEESVQNSHQSANNINDVILLTIDRYWCIRRQQDLEYVLRDMTKLPFLLLLAGAMVLKGFSNRFGKILNFSKSKQKQLKNNIIYLHFPIDF